jgi:hypothetical protein
MFWPPTESCLRSKTKFFAITKQGGIGSTCRLIEGEESFDCRIANMGPGQTPFLWLKKHVMQKHERLQQHAPARH